MARCVQSAADRSGATPAPWGSCQICARFFSCHLCPIVRLAHALRKGSLQEKSAKSWGARGRVGRWPPARPAPSPPPRAMVSTAAAVSASLVILLIGTSPTLPAARDRAPRSGGAARRWPRPRGRRGLGSGASVVRGAVLAGRARFPIPLSNRACGFPAHGSPVVFFAWLRCLRIANGAS